MKKSQIQDERVISQKRKIGSDAYGIISIGLIISIILQQYMFQASFSQYAVELILFVVGAIYVVVRNILVGNNLFNDHPKGQKIVVINSLVAGITIAIVVTTLNILNLGLEKMGGLTGIATVALATFFVGVIVSFICFKILYHLNKKKQKEIDDKYNDSNE